MKIEKEKLQNIVKKLEYEVEFNSPIPGIINNENIIVDWEDIIEDSEEDLCEICGCEHIDSWEAGACWSSHNDPDYDPFDI